VKLFAFHDDHACAYYRLLLPFDALRDLGGHEIDTNFGWHERCKGFPIIVSQRLSRMEALQAWRRLSIDHRLVYEIDDDLWTIDPTNFSAYFQHTLATQDGAEQAMAVSHLVTVSTEPLAEVVRQWNSNVAVLPNHIDGRMLEIERPRRDKLTIGWAGGDSHLRDIAMVADPLRRVLARYPEVDFHTIGTDFHKALNIPGRHTGWKDRIWDYYETIDFDIGIAPLVKSAFNESKSHIKALEYMALGIPVIASDLPPYNQLVINGTTGFLVKQEHEWRSRLRQLINDKAMREEMGAAGKERAAQWTIQNGWRRWETAYELVSKKQALEVA
jgi:glycosyltransferase involved in cell wall biosynthesis